MNCLAYAGIHPVQRLLPLAVVLVIALTVVELIRRRKLREEYAMLWLIASAVLLVFGIFPQLLFHISDWLGVYYLTAFFILAFCFFCLLMVQMSVTLSRLADDRTALAQRMALLEEKLRELQLGAAKDRPGAEPQDGGAQDG